MGSWAVSTAIKNTTQFDIMKVVISEKMKIENGQSVSLVLSKLRIRYKNDHKSRLAANTGLTLLSHI